MNQQQAAFAISFLQQIKAVIQRRIDGQEEVIDGLVSALVTGGHVLLESNPGLGKTELAKSFARSLKLGEGEIKGEGYGRIQFTPDLLPSDITGTRMPDPQAGSTRLVFEPGPIFREILLADEINRATPKTQAAMLEAMAERQVTVLGEARQLTRKVSVQVNGRAEQVETPFMVIATQNPIDQEGTFDLPEAQADRFQLKLLMAQPSSDDLIKIIRREAMGIHTAVAAEPLDLDNYTRDQCLKYLSDISGLIKLAEVPQVVELHATYLIQSTNGRDFVAGMDKLSKRRRDELQAYVNSLVDVPLGPRAAIALVKVIKAHALMSTSARGADQWTGQLPQSILDIGPAVLRHRLKLKMDWEDIARRDIADLANETDTERMRNRIITRLIALSAPQEEAYDRFFAGYL